MKRSMLLAVLLLLFLPAPTLDAQDLRVNTHGYSHDILTQDSVDTYPIVLQGTDVDTSETFDLTIFANLSSQTKFGFVKTAHADSISMSIYLQVTNDDTTWATVDSIGSADITVAKLVGYSGTDTAYVKSWTFPRSQTGRFILTAWAANAKATNGVNVYTKIFKQQ